MIIGEALGALGAKKLGDALGLGDIGSTILGGIGGFLGSLLPFKEGGKVPAGYRKVVHMGRVYLVAKKGKSMRHRKKKAMKKKK